MLCYLWVCSVLKTYQSLCPLVQEHGVFKGHPVGNISVDKVDHFTTPLNQAVAPPVPTVATLNFRKAAWCLSLPKTPCPTKLILKGGGLRMLS